MKSETRYLLLMFVGVALAKGILSYFVPSISAFSDEYYYAKLARSFFFSQDFSLHEIKAIFYQPLYPIILSVSYIFKDMNLVYLSMKIINAIISTAVIIPAFLLSREFLDEKKSLLVTALIAMMPAGFSMAPYLMAENLFYPLFLFSVYFLYKAFAFQKNAHYAVAGLAIGLTFLTKTNGIILIAVPLIFFVLDKLLKGKRCCFRNLLLLYAVAAITILPWLIRNLLSFGSIFGYNTVSDITAYARHQDYTMQLINWIILYFGYIILAGGIIFGVLALAGLIKNYNGNGHENTFYLLSAITIALALIVAANHATGALLYKTPISFFSERPIGRYVDMILPLVFIIGFINFYRYYGSINKYLLYAMPVLLYSTQLTIAPLLTPNNNSLTSLGALKYAIEFLLYNKTGFDVVFSWVTLLIIGVIFAVLCLMLMALKKIGLAKLAMLMMAFFALSSLLAYGITYYNANKYWFNNDQMQLGYFFNKYDKDNYSTVLIDERDCSGKIEKMGTGTLCENKISSIAGFFINDKIIVGNPEKTAGYDYAISRHKLGLSIVKDINGLYLYKKV